MKENSTNMQLFTELRKSILNGEYLPKERLVENTLAEKYNVSRTLIREALKQLQVLGLVDIIPNKGAIVAEVDQKEIVEIYIVRATLEGLAARLAAVNIDESGLKKLGNSINNMEKAIDIWDIEEFSASNIDFHGTINSYSENSFLTNIIHELYNRANRHSINFFNMAPFNPVQALEDHKEIYSVLKKGDQELAEQLMEQHTLSVLPKGSKSE